ncbi:glycine zipper 2TM domain-containing protein [Ramlibacter sp. XY19]|uniref:glycine zipper 2TM domain-containing protein n=1 Tax=Ramlibacter paludis TaxID=2908000 RepID=UPI0023DC4E1C|nr:glycine zipper 2TM domain-containing protein [Ramlibacter paludis]MCG2591539.1 glycine zipper 2TM domain-containing protein [Ramlibacter paludis]
MKRIALLTALAAAAAGAIAQPQGFVDNARVRSVEPQYESVQVPREECSSQWVNEARPVQAQGNSLPGIAIGAVVGGVLGNQVGKGHGKEAATAAGAVAGAMVGNSVATSGQQPQYVQDQREVRSCRQVVDVQNRLTGYRVNYEYHGQQYSTVMRENPGPNLQVRVSVEPLEREYHRQRR